MNSVNVFIYILSRYLFHIDEYQAYIFIITNTPVKGTCVFENIASRIRQDL
jgi:hypothetical protein